MADLNVTVYSQPFGIVGPKGADGVLSTAGVITFNGKTGNLQGVSFIAGTSNQITVSGATGAVTLSLPSTINNVDSITSIQDDNLTLTSNQSIVSDISTITLSAGTITTNKPLTVTGNLNVTGNYNGTVVRSLRGVTGTVGLSAGINISIGTVGNTLTVATTANVAKTDTAQTFTALQQFNGFSASDLYLAQSLDTPPGVTSPGTAGNILFYYESGVLYMYYCVQSGVWRRFTGSTY